MLIRGAKLSLVDRPNFRLTSIFFKLIRKPDPTFQARLFALNVNGTFDTNSHLADKESSLIDFGKLSDRRNSPSVRKLTKPIPACSRVSPPIFIWIPTDGAFTVCKVNRERVVLVNGGWMSCDCLFLHPPHRHLERRHQVLQPYSLDSDLESGADKFDAAFRGNSLKAR